MFRKKKNAGAFDDLPSPEAPKPTTRTESVETNYEGHKRGRKYEVEEVKEAEITWVSTKSERNPDYPDVVEPFDKYVVDTRIWDRVERYVEGKLDGAGGDGGPHTHTAYADKDHKHDLEDHTHDDYISKEYVDKQDQLWNIVAKDYTDEKVKDHTHDDFAGKEEFDDLKATVEEHLLNHPEGGGEGGTDTNYEFRWEHDDANSTPATGKGYWSSGETSFHLSKTDADLKPFPITTGKQDIVVKTGDATTNITEVLQVYDLGTGWVISINYTGDRPVFGEEIFWGVEEEEPEPEGPHWEFSYTNKFVRNQDGARWDNGGDGVGNQQAWLPDRDAEGNRFLTETQYEVKVEDEDGNRSSWANYRATYFPENGVQGYLLDFEAWGLLEGDVLYYEPSRKWVSGNKANDEVINRLFSEVDELKTRLQKHSHNYNGRFVEDKK